MIFFDFSNNIYPQSNLPYFQKVITFVKDWENGKKVVTIHTSGSTGIPKSIEITREQMIASAKLTGEIFSLVPAKHAFCSLNVDFIGGMMMLVRAMELKLQLTVIEPVSNPLLNVHSSLKIDFAAFVPLQIQAILDNEATKRYLVENSGLKNVIIGGAGINNQLLQQIEALEIPFFATYGMTETVSHIAVRRLNGDEKSEYFSTLHGIGIRTDDRNCLMIKGDCTNNLWIQTNDIVEFADENRFLLKGRADRVVNSGGIKIYLDLVEKEIEKDILVFFDKSLRYFLFGLPDERLGERLVLVIEAENPIFSTSVKEIFENSTLVKYKIPKALFFLPNFAQTASGKIDFYKSVELLNL